MVLFTHRYLLAPTIPHMQGDGKTKTQSPRCSASQPKKRSKIERHAAGQDGMTRQMMNSLGIMFTVSDVILKGFI